jgi:hypothetical protein
MVGESIPTASYTAVGTDAMVEMSEDDAALNVSVVEVVEGGALSRTITSAPSRQMATTIRPSAM